MASLTLGNKINNTRRHCYDVMSWRCRAFFLALSIRDAKQTQSQETLYENYIWLIIDWEVYFLKLHVKIR